MPTREDRPDPAAPTHGAPPPGEDRALHMRIGTGTRRLSSQHRQLDLFYAMVREALERGSLRGARVAFVRFRDALEAHVAMEEQVFFPALHGLDPSLEAELTGFVEDHAELRAVLERIHDLLAEGALETSRSELSAFADRVADHERREEDLVSRISGPSSGGPEPKRPHGPAR